MSSTRASNSQKPKFANCVHHTYLFVVYHRHSKVNCFCATFKPSKSYYLFCVIYSSWESSLKNYCGKDYVTYAFLVLISCLLCDNHAVMGNTINMFLVNIVWITMHAHLVWSKGDLPWVEKIGVCILLEKNIGPPTKAMFTWWKFQLDKSPNIYCPCFPGMDVQKVEIHQNWEIKWDSSPRTFVHEARRYPFVTLKTYVCDENPWKSKLIRTRCEY